MKSIKHFLLQIKNFCSCRKKRTISEVYSRSDSFSQDHQIPMQTAPLFQIQQSKRFKKTYTKNRTLQISNLENQMNSLSLHCDSLYLPQIYSALDQSDTPALNMDEDLEISQNGSQHLDSFSTDPFESPIQSRSLENGNEQGKFKSHFRESGRKWENGQNLFDPPGRTIIKSRGDLNPKDLLHPSESQSLFSTKYLSSVHRSASISATYQRMTRLQDQISNTGLLQRKVKSQSILEKSLPDKSRVIQIEEQYSLQNLQPKFDQKISKYLETQKDDINDVLNGSPSLPSHLKEIDIGVNEFSLLLKNKWLNDNVMNAYVKLLKEWSPKSQKASNIHIFQTFFYSILADKKKTNEMICKGLRRKKIDLTKMDLIIMPINVNQTHWLLAQIQISQRTISIYDSFSSDLQEIFTTISDFMEFYCTQVPIQANGNGIMNNKHWQLQKKDCPRQPNLVDCGVFTCMNMRFLLEGLEPDYDPQKGILYRQLMALEIFSSKVLEL